MKIQTVCQFLEEFAPLQLAEAWDNVGLLLGDRDAEVQRIMTCLTLTPESVEEAIDEGANLLVTHHPLPFKAMQKITTDSVPAGLIWQLARAGISIYSPHTAFDSTTNGINEQLGRLLDLKDVRPLQPNEQMPDLGAGRFGETTLFADVSSIAKRLKESLEVPRIQVSELSNRPIRRVAVACGSGGSFLSSAAFRGCDAMVTGEATFHTVLEARALGVILFLTSHYASERFALEFLSGHLAAQFPKCVVWASLREKTPLSWV
jgi:dinuclear metal center YbgI/SA1388 family protein